YINNTGPLTLTGGSTGSLHISGSSTVAIAQNITAANSVSIVAVSDISLAFPFVLKAPTINLTATLGSIAAGGPIAIHGGTSVATVNAIASGAVNISNTTSSGVIWNNVSAGGGNITLNSNGSATVNTVGSAAGTVQVFAGGSVSPSTLTVNGAVDGQGTG